MSIKIDLGSQIRQTVLPKWKPLLPLFEAVMNSFQAIKDARPDTVSTGRVTITIHRENALIDAERAPIVGFTIADNGIGLDDDNFESFNTAFSSRKQHYGGKGLGRFTWLKAFTSAEISSTFRGDAGLWQRSFVFDETYDLDARGLPVRATSGTLGTIIHLSGLRPDYSAKISSSVDVVAQKIIEHFILVFMETDCPLVELIDGSIRHNLNEIFHADYRTNSSNHRFDLNGYEFSLRGFQLPVGRTTKHKLVYAADQREVLNEKLEEFLPNLGSRLEDEDGNPFFYLAVVQGKYLSEHVNPSRTDITFRDTGDGDLDLFGPAESLIHRAAIRERCLEFIQSDLKEAIDGINTVKLERIERYVHQEAPQYRILMRRAADFIDKLPPLPTRAEIETTLHRELFQRETELKKESTRIIRDADKIDDYDQYNERLTTFIENYNELGMSALAQYVSHRKIILEFLEKAIELPEGSRRYPLERVVHQLVFPMQHTSGDIPVGEQNLWMLDERLTYHTFIASDKPLKSLDMLESDSTRRGDVVIFDEKIIFGDVDPTESAINSITTIEFKRPQRDDYDGLDNPLIQSFSLVEDIRSGKFKVRGRPVPISNETVPATIYCVCDITPSFRKVLKSLDAFVTPDGQGYYGYHRQYNAYYEVIDYGKMLRDAKSRNRIFFDKLNLVSDRQGGQ